MIDVIHGSPRALNNIIRYFSSSWDYLNLLIGFNRLWRDDVTATSLAQRSRDVIPRG